jgi:hypothetical protein
MLLFAVLMLFVFRLSLLRKGQYSLAEKNNLSIVIVAAHFSSENMFAFRILPLKIGEKQLGSLVIPLTNIRVEQIFKLGKRCLRVVFKV